MPFTSTRTSSGLAFAFAGRRISTSALPPETRSARLDNTRISVRLSLAWGGGAAWAAVAAHSRASQRGARAARNRSGLIALLTGGLSAPGRALVAARTIEVPAHL